VRLTWDGALADRFRDLPGRAERRAAGGGDDHRGAAPRRRRRRLGKTRVLTYRVAYLLEQGVHPNEILAITFTNKAAAEMRSRIEARSARARAIWILTFHPPAERILRRRRSGSATARTRSDQSDQVRLVRSCLEELERDPKRFTPRGIHTQISNARTS
jgi:DNA helicase-2/ATP-dependent DNA helicase PcrA